MGDHFFGESQGPELPPGRARTPFAPVCTASALNPKARLCSVWAPGQSEPETSRLVCCGESQLFAHLIFIVYGF